MTIFEHLADRWGAFARVVACVAALVLALGIHPPHAEAAGAPADHSHFGSSCIQTDFEDAGYEEKTDGTPNGHADCIELLDPLMPLPASWPQAFVMAAAPATRADPFQQHIAAFDPPPPRIRA